MLRGIFLTLLCASAAAQTQTVPISGTVTVQIPAPVAGPPGPAGAPGVPGAIGAPGPAGTSPSAASVAAALAATPSFVAAVAAAVGTPPSTCGSAPASTTATISCPTGFTGSWTQTTSYTSTAAPACWTPTLSPSSAPATACAPIIVPPPLTSACPATSGPLTLNAKVTRATGISPLLVFFDATGTTDSSLKGNTTAFQDVAYSWTFGDPNSGTWAYGSNPGKNSRNTATGGIAAHLYVTAADTTYPVKVTATDGTNTASCTLSVTAYNPAGLNGFASTTCVANATPVAGAGGCPAGAAVVASASFSTPLPASLSGKRVLFHCGDTFTGDNVTLSGVKWSVGAYGGCEGTQTNRPIFNDTGSNYQVAINPSAGDGRIADIDFEGNGKAAGAVSMAAAPTQPIPYQITLSNLNSNGNAAGYYWAQGAQWGLIGSTQLNSRSSIAVFINSSANNPTQWNGAFPNLNYQAALGNFVNGVGSAGGSGSGIEAFRTAACRLCAFENNTIENSNNVGAVFKLHNGNTNGSLTTWTGIYTEYIEISDNLFTGNSGAILSDIAPQNGGVDERLRNFVIERNLYSATTTAWGGELLMLGGANLTVRDNVFYMPAAGPQIYASLGVQFMLRGTGNLFTVQYNEAYNNTCYAPNSEPTQTCIGFDTTGGRAAATANSLAKNNLFYVPAATGPAVDNTGTGNTVSSNTVTVTANPGFLNASGKFALVSDFKPTANSPGVSVPVLTDALNIPWSPWSLGAVRP